MNLPGTLVALAWAFFVVYWIVSAFDTKRYAERNTASWAMRLIIIVVVILLLNIPGVQHYFVGAQATLLNPALQWLGVVFCVLGIALCIWARVHLGRNWGMPMTLKQDPELVTTGPYAYVRHPIYTGFILSALGSTLVSVFWLVPFIFFSVYFIFSAKAEEKIMLKEFPKQYPDYMKRTNMLIPFIF
ncbi:MAG TPA: isoprenylcysteine carboxylmethyltransferase family protein [Candidatus Paceibacterota bacterium]|jgi:protein-S-isoprenylcysteine O-methyltransferase Ste14|nr:isoprenylcysteine carboxylmethyltransferase family protein [Candidatus Paceibacterota bacterium]